MRDVEQLLQGYAAGVRTFHRYALRQARLRGANLCGADLSESSLIAADLSEADLQNAKLRRASLRGAHLSHTKLQGADLTVAILRRANLFRANLTAANVSSANLSGASLVGATLVEANLSNTILKFANLKGANLERANLEAAILTEARLDSAKLSSANLNRANLRGLSLRHANLSRTTAVGAILGKTVLIDVDLAPFCRGNVQHSAPSTVDVRSIIRSAREPLLKDFLLKTGMPDVFAEYMIQCAHTLDPRLIFSLLQSTFISYGGPDEAFAQKLNTALQSRGVTTFFFKEHAPPGAKLHRLMRDGINEHDRVILICSKDSLNRPGLLNELEETLAREARDGGAEYLIPIRIDNYVFDGWSPSNSGVAQAVRDRVVADFRDHEQRARFDIELAKLIVALTKPLGAGPS